MVEMHLKKNPSSFTKESQLKFCEKCGSVLIARNIKLKNGDMQKILQCIVCRYWTPNPA